MESFHRVECWFGFADLFGFTCSIGFGDLFVCLLIWIGVEWCFGFCGCFVSGFVGIVLMDLFCLGCFLDLVDLAGFVVILVDWFVFWVWLLVWLICCFNCVFWLAW